VLLSDFEIIGLLEIRGDRICVSVLRNNALWVPSRTEQTQTRVGWFRGRMIWISQMRFWTFFSGSAALASVLKKKKWQTGPRQRTKKDKNDNDLGMEFL